MFLSWDILKIKKSLSNTNISDISVVPYKKGDKVKLETGVFSSQNAIVQEITNTHCILVLESLGCVLKIKYNQNGI